MRWEPENYAEVPSRAITFISASHAKQVGTVESVFAAPCPGSQSEKPNRVTAACKRECATP